MKAQDLTGQRFGKLVVVSLAATRGKFRYWKVKCDCGTRREMRGVGLKQRRSCGCDKARIKHGHIVGGVKSRTYRSWECMRNRCMNPDHERWAQYGGRGIKVCVRWAVSFAAFLADMGERPAGMTLDRIDPNGNYEPGNCRWADDATQRSNKSK